MYATCITLPTDAATAQSVEALVEGTPDGLVVHVAGPTDDGWRIIDVWESEEHYARFQSGTLAPAVAQATPSAPFQGAPLAVTGTHERRAL